MPSPEQADLHKIRSNFFLFGVVFGILLFELPLQSYSLYVGPECNEADIINSQYFGPKIAFVSNVGSADVNDFSLFTVNSDATDDLVKIGKVASRSSPVLMSSDGKKIAFTGIDDGTNQVFVANTDGTGLLQLTHDDRPKSAIAISPDGKRIVYAVRPGDSIVVNYFAINNDGTDQVQLTNNLDEKAWPDVSADGNVLVFNDISNKTSKIFAVRTDGKDLHYVTVGSLFSHIPEVISSNGSKIVFSRDNQNDSNTKYLYVINTDGTKFARMLPYPIYSQSDFTISPDGAKVAFDDNNMIKSHVSVVNSDGTGYLQIQNSTNFMSMSVFSPDSSKLLFFAPLHDKVGLFMGYTGKGSKPVEITHGMYLGVQMFSQDGAKIIFSDYNNVTTQAYLTGLDGKNLTPLIDNSYFKPNPDCKIPDGGHPEYNVQDSQSLPGNQILVVSLIAISITAGMLVYFKIIKERK